MSGHDDFVLNAETIADLDPADPDPSGGHLPIRVSWETCMDQTCTCQCYSYCDLEGHPVYVC
ncbi:MAG: hypothetical protein L0I76_25225 [Pseudonocardia sp.]|nr:hypothetical protein [Pseudonocardia sp.]